MIIYMSARALMCMCKTSITLCVHACVMCIMMYECACMYVYECMCKYVFVCACVCFQSHINEVCFMTLDTPPIQSDDSVPLLLNTFWLQQRLRRNPYKHQRTTCNVIRETYSAIKTHHAIQGVIYMNC